MNAPTAATTLDSCPSQDELEAIAGGAAPPSPEVSTHVQACPRCRAELDRVRTAEVLLGALFETVGARGRVPEELGLPTGILPGYRFVAAMHSGGQGAVYKAVHEATGRTVAVKLLLAGRFATAAQRRRFEREAEIASSLKHPNVVTIYDSRPLADGRHAIVMEYIEGTPLDDWKPPARTERERIRGWMELMAQVCDAAEHAHQNGVIHRDFKPSNVLVEPVVGGGGRVRVLDFGVARPRDSKGATITQAGEFAGTLEYASPEQVQEAQESGVRADVRSDVYSIGVMLYRMICGVSPYPMEGSILQAARAIVETEPTPPSKVCEAVDRDAETIILKALHKDPQRRYQSAAGLGTDLRRYLSGDAIEARRDNRAYLARMAVRKHWVAIVIAAGAVLTPTVLYIQHLRTTRAEVQRELQVSRAKNMTGWTKLLHARLQANGEGRAGADSQMWKVLLDPFVAGADPNGFSHQWHGVEGRTLRWALREWYARYPCRTTIQLKAVPRVAEVSAGDAPALRFVFDGGEAVTIDTSHRGPATDDWVGGSAIPDGGQAAVRRAFVGVPPLVSSARDWTAEASSEWDIEIRSITSAGELEPAMRLIGHESRPVHLATSDDGRWLLSVSEDGIAKLWDVMWPPGLVKATTRRGPAIAVVRIRDDSLVLATDVTGATTYWRVSPAGLEAVSADSVESDTPTTATSTPAAMPAAVPDSIAAVVESMSGHVIALRAGGELVRCATDGLSAGGRAQAIDGDATALAASAGGMFYVIAGRQQIALMDAEMFGRDLARFEASPGGSLTCVAASPDGRVIVAGDSAGRLQLWNFHVVDACISGNTEYQAAQFERERGVKLDRRLLE